MRDRPYERQMDPDYIDMLNRAYDKSFLGEDRRVPVLVLDANQIDFVRHPEDLAFVENRIRQALLLAPFQPELPISG
jgi:deoxyguanosine kinase